MKVVTVTSFRARTVRDFCRTVRRFRPQTVWSFSAATVAVVFTERFGVRLGNRTTLSGLMNPPKSCVDARFGTGNAASVGEEALNVSSTPHSKNCRPSTTTTRINTLAALTPFNHHFGAFFVGFGPETRPLGVLPGSSKASPRLEIVLHARRWAFPNKNPLCIYAPPCRMLTLEAIETSPGASP